MTVKEKLAKSRYDAVVIGSGPNGLAAAIVMLQHGMSAVVIEAQSTAGGGCRSAELTLPGYVNDVCSAVHPLGIGSPFFRTLPLDEHGLQWIHPRFPYAHPFDGGKAILVSRSVEETADQLGVDAGEYTRSIGRLVPNDWDAICEYVRKPADMLLKPVPLARFGLSAIQSARCFAELSFKQQFARGTFAGVAAHSALRMEDIASASFGVVLGLAAHAVGWPIARGGSQEITNALVSYMESLGGEIIVGSPVTSMADLPEHKFVFFDVTPKQILRIAGSELPSAYRQQLENYKYGPATFKLDWALNGPIPWQNEGCRQAGTIHIGATLDEISLSERGNWSGIPPERPYVLLAQPTVFDNTRAPQGKHIAWGYCHVPNGCTFDMTDRIENQIERFAPGFKDLIVHRAITTPAKLEEKNANYVGGDINGGAFTLPQLFTRPVIRAGVPYALPLKGAYICSSASPPGGGVHGMCGYYAAHSALLGLT